MPENNSKPKGGSTVLWWLGWICLTILSFFVSCYFWTGVIAAHFGSMQKPGAPILWVTAVFGSWMVLLVPLIVVMYSKVDKAYEDARIGRETANLDKAKQLFKIRSVVVEEARRLLPETFRKKLKKIPATIPGGHLVTVVLKDGRRINHVFVRDKKEVLGIYDADKPLFSTEEIADMEPADLDHLPLFETEKWLRFDEARQGL